jgi:hypothetical protein
MTATAIATLQTPWDCRWSRPGHRITGLSDALQPESVWVCEREGHRRNLRDDECLTCAFWDQDPAGIAQAAVPLPAAATMIDDVARLALRLVLLAIAVFFIAAGIAILTRPLAIPVTVAFWVCGALAAAGSFWRFSLDDTTEEQK